MADRDAQTAEKDWSCHCGAPAWWQRTWRVRCVRCATRCVCDRGRVEAVDAERFAVVDAQRDRIAEALYAGGDEPEWLTTADGSPNAASFALADRVLPLLFDHRVCPPGVSTSTRDAGIAQALAAVEAVARVEALADEMEAWEWGAPVGPCNASYANGYQNGRRSVADELRATLPPEGGPQ